MIIIGIDPGLTNLGFCFLNTEKDKCWTKAWSGGKSSIPPVIRALDLAKTIIEHIPKKAIIFMENYSFASFGSLTQMAELGGILKIEILRATGFLPFMIPTNTIRKFLCGKGNLKKDMIPRETFRRFGESPKTSDECVALVLAKFGMAVSFYAGVEFPKKLEMPKYAEESAKKYATENQKTLQEFLTKNLVRSPNDY